MTDRYGRVINYMRVSITDRCNLRCRYCMPDGISLTNHDDILTYEEILRLCSAAVALGITAFKVTGGEPFVRNGCTGFIARLKALPGVEQVTITTNGLLLPQHLDDLCAAGIDGINISLDTLNSDMYQHLTGASSAAMPLLESVITECVERGLRVKINAVLLDETFDDIGAIAGIAESTPIDVRFIELMPIGAGSVMEGASMNTAFNRLLELWPDLHFTDEKRGNGPARYCASSRLEGRIGFIDAVSHQFCESCNRVRLTSTGTLKPCLCFEDGIDLRALLREGCSDNELSNAMESCIYQKPRSHCFSQMQDITEHNTMNRIGG